MEVKTKTRVRPISTAAMVDRRRTMMAVDLGTYFLGITNSASKVLYFVGKGRYCWSKCATINLHIHPYIYPSVVQGWFWLITTDWCTHKQLITIIIVPINCLKGSHTVPSTSVWCQVFTLFHSAPSRQAEFLKPVICWSFVAIRHGGWLWFRLVEIVFVNHQTQS